MSTITVCSDASFSYKYKKGAWACYIRTPYATICESGLIKDDTSSAIEAELFALANALYIVGQIEDLNKHNLIVYCDNQGALVEPKITKTPASRYYKRQVERNTWFHEHIKVQLDKARAYELRHVKGHTPRKYWNSSYSSRSYMNDFCDKEAVRVLLEYKLKLRGVSK